MKNKGQIIRNVILFILLMTITYIIIFKNYSLFDTINILLKVEKKYIVIAIICMLVSFCLESINIRFIIDKLGKRTSFLKNIKYALIGFFFSGITPGGSGGQPMQIYYMNKEGIPVSTSTIALLIEICAYHIVTIILGIIGLCFNTDLLTKNFIIIFIVGLLLKLIVLFVMLLGLFSKKMCRKLVNALIIILKKINYSKIDIVNDKIEKTLEQYHNSSKFIEENRSIFLISMMFVLFQEVVKYLVIYFVYRSFGLNQYNVLQIIMIQSLLLVSTTSIPLPGTVGISESVFLTLYLNVFGENLLASGMILSRGITFYLFMIISLIVVLSNIVYLKKKEH